MLSRLVRLQKSDQVLALFQNRASFSGMYWVALFADESNYYAALVAKEEKEAQLADFMTQIKEYTCSSSYDLARGDLSKAVNSQFFTYKLKVFPIMDVMKTKEFYKEITDEIACCFLSYYDIKLDCDFISEREKELFVFTVGATTITPKPEQDSLERRFPEFSSKLQQLTKEYLGAGRSLELKIAHDLFSVNHSNQLFSQQPMQLEEETKFRHVSDASILNKT